MNIAPDIITELNDNEIFVFGSNEAGIHGAGAAKLAREKFGAIGGEGFGLYGRSYAIPTKDYDIITLNLERIGLYILAFIADAKKHNNLNFLVTEIGCGLAGYNPKDIAPFFKNAPENVFLPKRFVDFLTK
jgi:hypothetical protein